MNDFRPTKGWLGAKQIPRNKEGDPAFYQVNGTAENPGVNDVFAPDEIVYLVNKAIYQLEYSRTYHNDRAKAEADRLKPLKDKVKELFGVSWMKATEQQVNRAMDALRKEAE